MIKTLSPYYVTTPFVSTATGLTSTSYTMEVFIWDGVKATPPGTATYTFTKNNPTASTGSDKVNISRLVNDYIDFTPVKATATSAIEQPNQVWVKTQVTYATTDPNDATTPQEVQTLLAAKGYAYGDEGENTVITTGDLMTDQNNYKVDRTSYACIPVLISESLVTVATVVSSPNSEINQTFNIAASTDSAEMVNLLWVDLSETTLDNSVVISVLGATRTLLIQDECDYVPIDIFFQNKDGGLQGITFFKEQKESLSFTDNQYESNEAQPSTGTHQFKRFNVQGRGGKSYSTGWVDEGMNDAFIQFHISERHWALVNDTFIPLNIKSKSFDPKTRKNDKLINYVIELDESWNKVNNI